MHIWQTRNHLYLGALASGSTAAWLGETACSEVTLNNRASGSAPSLRRPARTMVSEQRAAKDTRGAGGGSRVLHVFGAKRPGLASHRASNSKDEVLGSGDFNTAAEYAEPGQPKRVVLFARLRRRPSQIATSAAGRSRPCPRKRWRRTALASDRTHQGTSSPNWTRAPPGIWVSQTFQGAVVRGAT